MEGSLILFDGQYREKQILMNFEIPALYEVSSVYTLKAREGKAAEVTIKGI